MSEERLPATGGDYELAFDPRSPSPFVRRGLTRIAGQTHPGLEVDAGLSLLWRVGPEDIGGRFAPADVVVEGTVVIVPTAKGLIGVDAAIGEERWRFDATSAYEYAPGGLVEVGNGVMVCSIWQHERLADAITGDECDLNVWRLYALEVETGRPRWCRGWEGGKFDQVVPLVVAGTPTTVFVIVPDGDVLGLDADPGIERCRLRVGYSAPGSAVVSVHGDLAIFPFDDDVVAAVDITSGSTRWRRQGVTFNGTWNHHTVDDVFYYSLSPSPGLESIDLRTGTTRWRFDMPGHEGWSLGFAGAEDGIVLAVATQWMGSRRHLVLALDASTGLERWRFQLESELPNPRGPSVEGWREFGVMTPGNRSARGGPVLVEDIDHLYALDPASGAEQWRTRLDGIPRVLGHPSPARAHRYVRRPQRPAPGAGPGERRAAVGVRACGGWLPDGRRPLLGSRGGRAGCMRRRPRLRPGRADRRATRSRPCCRGAIRCRPNGKDSSRPSARPALRSPEPGESVARVRGLPRNDCGARGGRARLASIKLSFPRSEQTSEQIAAAVSVLTGVTQHLSTGHPSDAPVYGEKKTSLLEPHLVQATPRATYVGCQGSVSALTWSRTPGPRPAT